MVKHLHSLILSGAIITACEEIIIIKFRAILFIFSKLARLVAKRLEEADRCIDT